MLKDVCIGISERYDFEFDKIGTDGDHVHLLIGAPPKTSPSTLMQIVKSITARQMFKRFPEIKKQLWGGKFWSEGGYVGTLGEGVTEDVIRNYIERQGSSEEKEKYKQMRLIEV